MNVKMMCVTEYEYFVPGVVDVDVAFLTRQIKRNDVPVF